MQKIKRKNKSLNTIYICSSPVFKNIQGNIQKRVSACDLRSDLRVFVCAWKGQMMFFLFCYNNFLWEYLPSCPFAEQVSSGWAGWMRARLAQTKVLIQASVRGRELFVSMCRCASVRDQCVCARTAAERERAREARRRVFTHAWSIHSLITAASTHTS